MYHVLAYSIVLEMKEMINVKNLTKKYHSFEALKGVSFTIKKGEVVGFLGPNGAGKTSTMKILTGYMPMSSGTATIDGLDVFATVTKENRIPSRNDCSVS